MTGTDLAVVATIVVGYVTGIFATLHYLAGRLDRLADEVHEVKVTVARIDERLTHLEPQQ